VAVGLLHPGEMGAAIGSVLRAKGKTVLWASEGRTDSTVRRARNAGLEDVRGAEELTRRSDVIICLCPPHAAVEVASALPPFAGIYVDANAISPSTARLVAEQVGAFVDGGVVGSPPRTAGTTRLYLSGGDAHQVADLFADTIVQVVVVSAEPGDASAVKMVYAAWTKGTSALLLAIRAVARAEGVEETLLDEWRMSLPRLPDQSLAAARSALAKGWRWVGEMDEIAETFAAAGLPDGFHRAAADIYRRAPRATDADESLERVLAALLDSAG
jgi:3-hydroxyisobutyrate dehydrogenase-like beta-hydroxyacid dehydrogenase